MKKKNKKKLPTIGKIETVIHNTSKSTHKEIEEALKLWGTFEPGPGPKARGKLNATLVPIGKDGKEIEWYGRGWDGVIKYAKALGLNYTHVGNWLEKNFGDRTTIEQIIIAQEVHKALEKVPYRRTERLKMAPSGIESNMHYALRTADVDIFKLYEKYGGKAKDQVKAITKLYKEMMRKRPEMVTAYKYEEKLNREDSEKLAEAKAKVLGDDKLFKDIDFNKKSK
jgi:hypothetical protein